MADSIQKPNQSLLERYGSWEQVYRMLAPEELPWNAGGPDPDLVQYVESKTIPVGRAIDLGTGTGHDAIYLAQKGFRVLAIDVSAKAIELAQANAEKASVAGAIEFRVEDVLQLSSADGSATLANDRGCFHLLPPGDRRTYIDQIYKVLAPGGLLLLRTFSEKEPPGPGPCRFTRKELEDLFSPKFNFLEVKESILLGPKKPKTYLCLLQKKT